MHRRINIKHWLLCVFCLLDLSVFWFLTLVSSFLFWYYFFTGWSNYPQTSERVTYKSSSKPRARFLSGPVSLSICLYLLSSGIASLVFLFYFCAFRGFVSLVLSIASCFAVLLGCLVFCLTPLLALMFFFLFFCFFEHRNCLFKPVNSNIFKIQLISQIKDNLLFYFFFKFTLNQSRLFELCSWGLRFG